MKNSPVLILIIVLIACSQSSPTDTVESLAANPERLKELRAQCKADHAKLGVSLLQRTTRKLSLTEEGRIADAMCQRSCVLSWTTLPRASPSNLLGTHGCTDDAPPASTRKVVGHLLSPASSGLVRW